MIKRSLVSVGAVVTALAVLAPPAPAALPQDRPALVESPDEEDLLDLVPWPDPIALPSVLDIGLIHEQVESAIPDIIDEWADVSVGSCSLSSTTPSLDGIRVVGRATFSCGSPQTVAKLAVCLQRRVADRWEPILESCRPKAGVMQNSISKRTSAVCVPGTWRYRVYPVAVGVGTHVSVISRAGGGARITCYTD
ncbi:MAG TPA: hypothetical protein VHI97_03955 [Actinomycetota bacterium]|nr:hypothetical protein [Actinomycetota bacterium]